MGEKLKDQRKYVIAVIAVLIAAILGVVLITLCFGRNEEPSDRVNDEDKAEKSADQPYCILVMGSDAVSGLYDVMTLVSFDSANERICILQLPRDTYAEYTEGSYKKLNGASRALGGAKELCGFIGECFQISIDGYVCLDLEAFRDSVDAIGGVEIELQKPLKYTDADQGLYIDLPSGVQVLDGKHAEMLVRYRKGYADGDLGRLDVQKKFLAALFASFKEKVSAENIAQIIGSIIGRIDTDISLSTAVALGLYALSVENSSLVFSTLPGEAVVGEQSGASYYVMSASAADRLLCEYFGKSKEDEIDKERLFCHPSSKSFISAYEKETEAELLRADELD